MPGRNTLLSGALIVESLQAGVVLDDPGMVVRRFSRASPAHVTPGQTAVSSLLELDSDTADPDLFAEKLSHWLDSPGWCANLYSDGQIYVIFPERMFTTPARTTSGIKRRWHTRRSLASQSSSATGDSKAAPDRVPGTTSHDHRGHPRTRPPAIHQTQEVRHERVLPEGPWRIPELDRGARGGRRALRRYRIHTCCGPRGWNPAPSMVSRSGPRA